MLKVSNFLFSWKNYQQSKGHYYWPFPLEPVLNSCVYILKDDKFGLLIDRIRDPRICFGFFHLTLDFGLSSGAGTIEI